MEEKKIPKSKVFPNEGDYGEKDSLNEVSYKNRIYKPYKEHKTHLITLDLSNKGIGDISSIEGLKNLTYLQKLILDNNNILEIKGLDNLVSLEELHLENNDIFELKGLTSLKNLRYLNLYNNPVYKQIRRKIKRRIRRDVRRQKRKDRWGRKTKKKDSRKNRKVEKRKRLEAASNKRQKRHIKKEIKKIRVRDRWKRKELKKKQKRIRTTRSKFGKIDSYNAFINANLLVEYCVEQEMKEEEQINERIKENTRAYLVKVSDLYKELPLEKICSKTGINLLNLEFLIEEMLIDYEISGRIEGKNLIFDLPKSREEQLEPKLSYCFACGAELTDVLENCSFCGIDLKSRNQSDLKDISHDYNSINSMVLNKLDILEQKLDSHNHFYQESKITKEKIKNELSESLLPITAERNIQMIRRFFSKSFTLLNKQFRKSLLELNIPVDEKEKLIKEIAFLTQEEQEDYLELFLEMYGSSSIRSGGV